LSAYFGQGFAADDREQLVRRKLIGSLYAQPTSLAMGALAGMAGAMNVQESSQNEYGYSRTQTGDGRVITENVDTSVGSASYGIVGRGVAVTADGSGGVSIEQVRAAVQTVGVERLEREIGS